MTYPHPDQPWAAPAPKKKSRGCLTVAIIAVVLSCAVLAAVAIGAGIASETATTATTTTVAGQTGPTDTGSETKGQSNARAKASDYLKFAAFSRTGLIGQLTFEGFSEEDATYGADSQNADWNEQAAKKAAEYLKHQSFSRSGLVDQLVFEGFTPEQAAHGVSTTGLTP